MICMHVLQFILTFLCASNRNRAYFRERFPQSSLKVQVAQVAYIGQMCILKANNMKLYFEELSCEYFIKTVPYQVPGHFGKPVNAVTNRLTI